MSETGWKADDKATALLSRLFDTPSGGSTDFFDASVTISKYDTNYLSSIDF